MTQHDNYRIHLAAKIRLFVLVVLVPTPSLSIDAFSLGTQAYSDGLYAEAASHWIKIAVDDHGAAQFNLGVLYEHGKGVEKNVDEAVRWYTLAAKNGVVDAQLFLANLLAAGAGRLPRDIDQAIYWYVQAADAGQAEAQFKLGKLFVEGNEIEVDEATGISWLEIAAANHHLEAASLLRRLADRDRREIHQEAWLRAQDPGHFTVRLYSAPRRIDAEQFIIALGIEGACAYSTGPDRHHVAAGLFATEHDAQAALRELPVALRARRPRVVQIATIVASLADPVPTDVASMPTEIAASVSPTPLDPTPENAQVPPPPPVPAVHGDEWLRSRDPGHFTAVLFGSARERDAFQFLIDTGLEGGAIYRTRDGEFRVLGGLFESVEQANQSIDELPPLLKRFAPWPISFGDVADDLEAQ